MLLLAAALSGCTCRPEPTLGDSGTPPVSTAETSATGDTGPPPPCDQPEEEPNDSLLDAPELVLERHACGTFGSATDLDVWSIVVEEEVWLSVELEGGDGSVSDVALGFAPVSLAWLVERGDDHTETNDAHLRFLAPADTYTVTAKDAAGQSGERATWDLLVSEAKPPVVWTSTEAEPNDVQGAAQPVVAGEVVFSTMEGNPGLLDRDWFTIDLPPGKQTLTVEIVAWTEGSAADLTLYLVDPSGAFLPPGCSGCAVADSGPPAFANDPFVAYDSAGGETVAVQVVGDDEGIVEAPASWYTIAFGVEGE
jgi:hypothetical protein